MQTDSKPRRMSYVGIAVVTICVLLPLVMALGLAVLIFGLRNTQNSQQASAYFKMQQMENLRESQLYLAELNKKQNAKQLAAVERETEEVEDQIELSKDWTLTFPENVQDIEFAGVIVDENGRYRLYLNPEVYTIAAISERHGVERVQNIELIKDEVQTLDLQLQAGVHFLARVLDEESGEPVAGLTLYHRTNAGLRGVSNADGLIEISNALPGVEELQVGSGTPAMVHGYFACPTERFRSWSSPEAKKPWHRTTTTEVAIMFDLSPNMNPVTIYVQSRVQGKAK